MVVKIIYRIWLWLTKPAELVDWLGDGARTVPLSEALRRSELCLSCPLNRRGNFIVGGVAVRIKNRLGLKLPKERYLHSCMGCGCFLPLKIWVKHEHIKAWQRQTTADRIREVEPKCWQL